MNKKLKELNIFSHSNWHYEVWGRILSTNKNIWLLFRLKPPINGHTTALFVFHFCQFGQTAFLSLESHRCYKIKKDIITYNFVFAPACAASLLLRDHALMELPSQVTLQVNLRGYHYVTHSTNLFGVVRLKFWSL